MAFEPRCEGSNVAHHDGREQRLLAGKARVDGRFSGAGDVGNLVDAGAGKAAFEKHAAGGSQDARIDFAGALTRRPADASRRQLGCPSFCPRISGHDAPSHCCDHVAASPPNPKKAAVVLGV